MSDFGSEVGNSALSMGGNIAMKLMEGILSLIKKIFDIVHERTSAEYQLKKEELKGARADTAQKDFIASIENKVGYVAHNDLVRASVPLTATGVKMTKEDFKEICSRCKREGITISALEDIRERGLNGKHLFVIECKESDLQRFANLADLMNDEKRLKNIDVEISKIKNNGNLDQRQVMDIKNLEQEKQNIRDGYARKMNDEQAVGVVEMAVAGETKRGMTFDEAINHYTGGNINEGTTSYIVDAKAPNKYIECKSYVDNYREHEYTKTDYTVYNGNEKIFSTNDGRFDGRPKDYWPVQRTAIQQKGGFDDLVLKFSSLAELEAYRKDFFSQNTTELSVLLQGAESRDYAAITKTLENKLDECGAVYKDGAVLDKSTGQALVLSEGMTDVDRARVAEAALIGKQISNYQEISILETDLTIARTSVLTTAEGTPEHNDAQAVFEKTNTKYEAALNTESALIEERKAVNAIQAEQGVRNAPQIEQALGELSKELSENEDEHTSNIADGQYKMEDYKELIDGARKNEGTKGVDAKDLDGSKVNVDVIKAVPSTEGR